MMQNHEKTSTASLLRGWVWHDGIKKSSEAVADKLPKRLNARESHSLLSSWMLDEGFGKLWREQPSTSSRARIVSAPRSSLTLMNEWVWNQGIARMFSVTPVSSRSAANSRLASSWLLHDGAARLPSHITATNEIAKRSGVGRANVAYSWLVSTGFSRALPKSRVGIPAAAAAAAGCVALLACGSIARKAFEEQRPAASSALARQNSTGAVAYILRKVA